ncbi:MAG TPA: hypothetical protein VFT66_08620 [Roseiflexaceae bacterium]|nr:hypothetical protein [Roseiflexaceae bacterium]
MSQSTLRPALLFDSRRVFRLLLWSIMLASLMLAALPTHAAERVDQLPFVNNYATARFKLLSMIDVGGDVSHSYGAGETVLPDRISFWLGTNGSNELVYYVQIGDAVYQREGNGAWQRSDQSAGGAGTQPMSAQFNLLQRNANAILKIGSEPVNGMMTDHYQVWLSGERALTMDAGAARGLSATERALIKQGTYKYDFWINPQDGFLYQQNVEFTLPASELNGRAIPPIRSSTLLTYFDINDPNISVSAPQ